jgi:hypothetical protein
MRPKLGSTLPVSHGVIQGCQMVCFQTKNPNLGKFWRVLLWTILAYLMTISFILRQLKIFYGHLIYFVLTGYNFPRFGILDQEKSGNPGVVRQRRDTKIHVSCKQTFSSTNSPELESKNIYLQHLTFTYIHSIADFFLLAIIIFTCSGKTWFENSVVELYFYA